MYLQLYQFTNTGIDAANSLADAPVYSDGNKVVTIHLKSFKWSDGTPVTARDVEFFFNLAKANEDQWSGYVLGQFPANVTSLTSPNSSTIVAHLNKAYDPVWFTDNELSW